MELRLYSTDVKTCFPVFSLLSSRRNDLIAFVIAFVSPSSGYASNLIELSQRLKWKKQRLRGGSYNIDRLLRNMGKVFSWNL